LHSFFIAGTDTGVGKTLVSAGLLAAAKQRGISCLGIKPIAAGGSHGAGLGSFNEDALELQSQSSVKLSYDQVNPVFLKAPMSPNIAAEREGKRIDLDSLVSKCRLQLESSVKLKVIEGAGGWRVPINETQYMSDLAVSLELDVVLVVGIRLGCINHSVLSAEAIHRDGLSLRGWVANCVDPGGLG